MSIVSEDQIGHYITVHMFSGNKNSGTVTSVTPESVSMAFGMHDKEQSGERKEMVVTIRQDRIESYGELTK